MTADPKNRATRPGKIDILLFLTAIIGIWSFLVVLPEVHPDSTARYNLGRDQVIDHANIFLAAQGYAPDQLNVKARLRRNSTLLREMQQDLGRARAIDVLRSDEGELFPGYFWSVIYSFRDPLKSSLTQLNDAPSLFEIKMTQDGEIWSFQNDLSSNKTALPLVGQTNRPVNRDALAAVFSSASSVARDIRARMRSLPDSTLQAKLSFRGVRKGRNNVPDDSLYATMMLEQLENGQTVELDSQAVLSLARFYEPKNLVGHVEWRVDSLQVTAGSAARIAELRLISADSVFGQIVRLDMTVSTLGSLRKLDLVFNPDRVPDTLITTALSGAMIGLYLILVIIFIVVFFKRMAARLIDVKPAMIDAVIVGIFMGLSTVLSVTSLADAGAPVWVRAGIALLIFSVTAGAFSLFVFTVSAVSESITREVWPEKWLSFILIRKGDIRNVDVGWSILRGISVAGVLLGAGVLALVLGPSLNLNLPTNLFTDRSLRPVLSAIAGRAGTGYLSMMILLIGIGSLAFRFGHHAWATVSAITLFGGLLQIAPFSLGGSMAPVVISATSAFILGLSLVRYDFFTTFLGFIIATIFWSLNESFLITGSPTWVDGILAVLLLAGLFVIGLVGVLSGVSGGKIEQFIPEYISELASQERVKRELEIAHQVQGRFLPRQMPRIEGLDIAGMCLPANEVGGDYFDFIKITPQRLAVVVGDVSGKGIEASFYMTLVKGVVQTLSTSIDSPAEVMRRTNEVFRRNAPPGIFITMMYGVVDVSSKTFRFSRAGHNPTILKRADSPVAEPLQPRGMAIGFADGELFDKSIEEVCIRLSPGDVLVFYTDGFSEAMNSDRELYGDDRLDEKVGHIGDKSSGAILRGLMEDVHHFIEGAGRSDDMTMVVIKLKP